MSNDVRASEIKGVIGNSQQLQRMSRNCAKLAAKNAANLVVATMEKYTTHDTRL